MTLKTQAECTSVRRTLLKAVNVKWSFTSGPRTPFVMKKQHNKTALVTLPLSLKLWVHNSPGRDKEACEGVAWEEETPPGDAAGESQGGRQCRHATETGEPSRDWLEQRLSVLGLKVLGLKKKDSGLTRCSGPPGEQWQTHLFIWVF